MLFLGWNSWLIMTDSQEGTFVFTENLAFFFRATCQLERSKWYSGKFGPLIRTYFRTIFILMTLVASRYLLRSPLLCWICSEPPPNRIPAIGPYIEWCIERVVNLKSRASKWLSIRALSFSISLLRTLSYLSSAGDTLSHTLSHTVSRGVSLQQLASSNECHLIMSLWS